MGGIEEFQGNPLGSLLHENFFLRGLMRETGFSSEPSGFPWNHLLIFLIAEKRTSFTCPSISGSTGFSSVRRRCSIFLS